MTHVPPTGDTPPPSVDTASEAGRLRRLATIVPLAVGVARRMAVTHGGYPAAMAYCIRILRWEGIRGFRNRLGRLRTGPEYGAWIARYDTFGADQQAAAIAAIATLRPLPRFSILMTTDSHSSLAQVDATIGSIQAQVYPHWELCIACDASLPPALRHALDAHRDADARIRVMHRDQPLANPGNDALSLASGSFVASIGPNDLLPPHALFVVARYIERHPQARLFYSDEDQLDEHGTRNAPCFKPDWNPLLFRAQDLFSHLGVFDAALIREAGGFRPGFGASYDLALRCIEIAGENDIVHIPHVLYHRRVQSGDTASAKAQRSHAERQALLEHLQRTNLRGATVEAAAPGAAVLRVRYPLPQPAPLVSIIVPTRDSLPLLRTCLDSLMRTTRYPNYEIIVVDNGSIEPATLAYFEQLGQQPRVRILRDDSPFNFSALNNRAAAIARGAYLCLLNNDTEIQDGGWLDEMVALAALPGIGAVGAALRYPDGQLQHGGVLLGLNGTAGHLHHMLPRGQFGYMSRAISIQNVSAVTAACLVVSKAIYDQVGGLEETLRVAFNDVDFCLKVREAGYRNAWTPFAELTHHESASRGTDMSPEKYARFLEEAKRMEARWGDALLRDPAYNPNLSLADNVPPFSYAEPPRIGMLD
ncbi:glycosyltransferase family 2 protein [Burkholderia sp. Ac-20379]|uniref:glycosyltransferase family 2 protein n=1 Tax=Burkholderia sp. Ac-20379 TaxID=2703900 RepID=UPI00197E76E3|nr:glycosyltransferase family 2 protein [Burkholderia sp. Ac-20379]MBN3723530.1 glycosyltransferase [Burkholderia sp. Ac-20379]